MMDAAHADDAYVEVEDLEDAHEERLPFNHDPAMLYRYYSTSVDFLAAYGWHMIAALVLLYILWRQLKPMFDKWRYSSQVAVHKKYDVAEVEKRQLAMEAHRRRLQEEHDRKAAEHAEKQAELEEKKRLEKLEDWDRHQSGQGYRSKVKKAEEAPPATVIPKKKKTLRNNDYNPLMGSEGASSGASWRSRRGPAAGGG